MQINTYSYRRSNAHLPEIWDYWREIFYEIDAGVVADGYRLLIDIALEQYPANATLREIANRYAPTGIDKRPGSGDPAGLDEAESDCHVAIVRDHEWSEDEAVRVLTAAGLAPRLIWSSAGMALYRVGTGDTGRLRDALHAVRAKWTAFPPGTQPQVLERLVIQGPDGRSFRFSDVPVTTRVADVAAAVVAEYGPQRSPSEASRPFAADLVGDDGVEERLSPSATLHEAGVQDGSSLRVGFQATAGVINPSLRQEALQRARTQILKFAAASPDVGVHSNSHSFPTVYEIEFSAQSFGPPAEATGEPVVIDRHLVQIELGADYPLTAPVVFWLTAIFHPNIYPAYDCELARQRPQLRGLVCLNELSEAYRPDLDLGYLCQVLRDLAGYRNYSLMTRADAVDAAGRPDTLWHNNAFDLAAAQWAMAHPERIVAIGGRAWQDLHSSAATASSFIGRIERLSS
jgi:hypothetical protein